MISLESRIWTFTNEVRFEFNSYNIKYKLNRQRDLGKKKKNKTTFPWLHGNPSEKALRLKYKDSLF